MRISDDRYTRDLLRYDLARRLIKLQARTQTISLWTGLTPDRIRKFYRMYPPGERVQRRRGKSPRQVSFFLRSHRRKFETGVLASLFSIFEALPAHPNADFSQSLANVHRGGLLCDSFDAYSAMLPKSSITFEHAGLLLEELVCGQELQRVTCGECSGMIVVDRLSLLKPRCPQCRMADARAATARR
jgi:hypothetical protein